MPGPESVRCMIDQIRAGDGEAVGRLWDAFFPRLVPLANKHLKRFRAAQDGEDVALSAIKSFCARVGRGQYDDLKAAGDLWGLLAAITVHKAKDVRRRELRIKRGGGNVMGESELNDSRHRARGLDDHEDYEPTAEAVVLMADELRWLLAQLEDDSMREVAILRLEGHSVAEISRKLGVVNRTVERKLSRTRNIWAKEFE